MKKLYFLFSALLCLPFLVNAQIYSDYIGAGHSDGVTITSSGNNTSTQADNTLNGVGLMPDQGAASRFLAQATFGGSFPEIQNLSDDGFSAWFEAEINKPLQLYTDVLYQVGVEDRDAQYDYSVAMGEEFYYGVYAYQFHKAWGRKFMIHDDHFRQRIAYSLSNIFVISEKSNLSDHGMGMANFYDILYRNAFGNYKDILREVSLNPMMASYLSHFNNPKSDPANNIHPDENYAREVMQLFTIGLYELNQDGTRQTDANGNWIATYGNEDVKEFAKVFTGFSAGAWDDHCDLFELCDIMDCWPCDFNYPFEFGEGFWGADKFSPMVMYQDHHEPGPKNLLNGMVVPAGQSGMQDFEMAIDNLFYHPNLAPFIGKRLIQHLVKSNPSQAYVSRVSAAFNDNGSGVKGDMQAILRAILLDPEARNCDLIGHPQNGKLREPMLRFFHWTAALEAYNYSNEYNNSLWYLKESINQTPLSAPSVFGFYSHNYAPTGEISDAGLKAPEMQMHNTSAAVRYLNLVNTCLMDEDCLWSGPIQYFLTEEEEGAWWDDNWQDRQLKYQWDDLISLANDIPALVDQIDILVTHGTMTENTRLTLINAGNDTMNGLEVWEDPEKKTVKLLLYLTFISPDYAILK